jgi:pSer/pThr/pTyr-binding forkhead associated (FHA) protein
MARLVLNYEGVSLVTHELIDDIVMVGRAPSNHIVIDHLTVSAQHALLLRVRDAYWLKDLDSTNRTQINDHLVTEAELNDGDRIRFGAVTAVYAGCSRKRSSTCAIKKLWTSSTTRPKSDAAAGDIQNAIEESYARKAIGESLLAHLDKQTRIYGRETHRSAIDFWANHIRELKDS